MIIFIGIAVFALGVLSGFLFSSYLYNKNRPFQYTDKFNKILDDIDKKLKK